MAKTLGLKFDTQSPADQESKQQENKNWNAYPRSTITLLNTIQWVFSGIGVLVLGLLARAGIFLWDRRFGAGARRGLEVSNADVPVYVKDVLKASVKESDFAAALLAKPRFTRPTPYEMTKQLESVPPFQQKTTQEAYGGLRVCWQALFRDVEEDVPANEGRAAWEKKWIVKLKHYDPSVDYPNGDICCPGIELEMYPELKTLQRNELVVVSGTVACVRYCFVLLHGAQFEFSGTRISGSRFFPSA